MNKFATGYKSWVPCFRGNFATSASLWWPPRKYETTCEIMLARWSRAGYYCLNGAAKAWHPTKRRVSMVSVFHGKDEDTHQKFQAWRKANVNGFHMTESAAGQFTIHYTQDKRENSAGRGCGHQGGSDNEYPEDKDGCYTTARKVCSNNLAELIAWATENGFTTKKCKHCDTKRFPFPTNQEHIRLAEEVPSGSAYSEGSVQQILINRYERDPRARDECIRHYGTECDLCGFDFVAVYGQVMKGFIHVHHLKSLSSIGAEYKVDPVQDLRPVCPNCHAVLHHREPPFSLEEVRRFLQIRVKQRIPRCP